jgi:GTP-binding protein HflX
LLPQIEVYNKADLLGEVPRVEMTAEGGVRRVWVSAQTGAGIDLLIQAVADFLGPGLVHRHVVLQPAHGRARARFFAAGAVLAEQMLPSGETDLEISMPRQAFENLCRTEGLELSVDDSAQPCAPGEPFLQSRVPTRWFG